MKITIESTGRIVELRGGQHARIWEGRTESGIPVICLVTRLAVERSEDQTEFDRELDEQPTPRVVGTLDLEGFVARGVAAQAAVDWLLQGKPRR